MKAVIYARYSSDNQREESIEGQLRECTAFAEKNGITILRNYIDRAYSAKTDNRPAFQEMIKDSAKKLFDMIIVWKLDRFARNRYDSARYKAVLKKNGVKVVSATEVISEGAEGIILESVLEGYAEYYSADLSEKVIRGMTENALKGKFNGGRLPIGYTVDAEHHLQIDPLTAPFVLEAYKRYADGATMTQIRDWLNEQGVRNKRGLPMNYNSVQLMLHNRRYIGEFRFRDIIIPTDIEPIVPKELFERVQERMEENKKAPARHKAEDDYLLTTKLFCGYCGAYLCGEAGTSHVGKVYHYYKCVSAKKHRGCHKKPVRKDWIEDLVVDETMKMLSDDRVIEAIVSMVMDLQDRENTTLPVLEQQLREAETGIENILNAIQQGILTKSTKSRLEELEASKEELENKIANEKLEKPRVPAEFVTFWLERFRKLDVRKKEHRQMLIDSFINAIYLYDDKLVITFNYKDGTKTITWDDAKEAVEKTENGSDLDCLGALHHITRRCSRRVFASRIFLYLAIGIRYGKFMESLLKWSELCDMIALLAGKGERGAAASGGFGRADRALPLQKEAIHMKKLLSVTLALALAVCLTAFALAEDGDLLSTIQERGTLIIATEGNWQPWTYHDEDDNLTGLDIEIGTLIAEGLGVEPDFQETQWDSILAGVDAGRFDIACNGVGYTETRAEKYSFSTPYVYTQRVLVVRGDNEDIHTLEDLEGRVTANTASSTYAALAEEYGATVTPVDDLTQTILLVEQGRVDATINSKGSIEDYLSEHPDADIKIAQVLEKGEPVAYPVRKGEDTETLVAAINDILEAARQDGTLAAISEKYFGEDLTK